MSTSHSPETRAVYKVLRQVLEPRPPVEADLRITHSFLTEDPAHSLPAFYYWAAGVDPESEGSAEQLVHSLAELPQTPRGMHVYRVCRRLSQYAAFSHSAPLDTPREVQEDVRITYLLWAALTAPHAPRNVMRHCNEAGRVNLIRATSNPLFHLAMRRLAAHPTPSEVQ